MSVSPKNNRRLRLFFDRKTGECVVAGHVKKLSRKKIIAADCYFLVKLALGNIYECIVGINKLDCFRNFVL